MLIRENAAFAALNPTDLERQAVGLRWSQVERRKGDVPAEDAVRLLGEIRERVGVIESHVASMPSNTAGEGRRTPRRHMRFALSIIGAVIVGSLVLGLVWGWMRSVFSMP